MNRLDAWPDSLAAPVAAPSAPPPDSEAQWARRMERLCRSLLRELRPRVAERGDAADQAAEKVRSFLDALLDHPRHGRNWLERHRAETRALLAPFFPDALGAERELEGHALQEELIRLGFRHRVEAVRLSVSAPTRADGGSRARATGAEPGQRGMGL